MAKKNRKERREGRKAAYQLPRVIQLNFIEMIFVSARIKYYKEKCKSMAKDKYKIFFKGGIKLLINFIWKGQEMPNEEK